MTDLAAVDSDVAQEAIVEPLQSIVISPGALFAGDGREGLDDERHTPLGTAWNHEITHVSLHGICALWRLKSGKPASLAM